MGISFENLKMDGEVVNHVISSAFCGGMEMGNILVMDGVRFRKLASTTLLTSTVRSSFQRTWWESSELAGTNDNCPYGTRGDRLEYGKGKWMKRN